MESLLAIVQINDTIVYSTYGQVFFSLGLVVALYSRKHSQLDLARQLVWLAAFGLSHGMYEWAHVFIPIQATYLPPESIRLLVAARSLLLGASFFFLAQFGCLVALPNGQTRRTARIGLLIIFLAWLAWTLTATDLLDGQAFSASASARRLLGLPASCLAAIGMLRQARSVEMAGLRNIARDFRIAGACFGAYAFLAGFVVSPAHDQLAPQLAVLGSAAQLFGLPAPVLRSMAGLGMAFGIVRGLRIFEIETGRLLESAERARLRAQLLGSVITAQEEERRRVARELHDQTGQSLVAVIMALGAAAEQLDAAPGRVHAMVEEARQVAVQALEGTRELILGLRPAALDDLGLVPAIRRFAEDLAGRSSVAMEVHVGDLPRRLPPDVEVVMFRILQEGLNNVARHARARRAVVRIWSDAFHVGAEVADDGTGFDLADATARPETGRGLGLLGMKERARLLGGSVDVRSKPGGGTRIAVSIPLTGAVGRSDP